MRVMRRWLALSGSTALMGGLVAASALSQEPPPRTSTQPVLTRQRVAAQQQTITVPVPNLIGDSVGAALAKLRAVGLQGSLPGKLSVRVPGGTVVRQEPAANTRVLRGSAVTLYLGVAPEMAVVPNVVGDDVPTALRKLRSFNLQPGLPRLPSTALSTGIVSAQSPNPGTSVPMASTVKLAIRAALIDVPSVVGTKQSDGEWAITSRGLRVGAISTSYSDEHPAGEIAFQNPGPPAQLQSGQGVDLTISLGPHPQAPMVRVPDLLRLPIRAAVDTLRRVRLAFARPAVRVDSAFAGLVISQDPAPHSIAHVGDTVRLVMGIPPRPALSRVPSVTGLDRSLAERVVRDSGFAPLTTVSPSDSDATERVISQKPTGGTLARRGTTVDLAVSRQMAPPPAEMPNVVGMLEDDARRTLASIPAPIVADWEPTTVEEQQARVLAQSPAPHAPVPTGQPIRIRLGRYTPPPIDTSTPARPDPQPPRRRTTVPDVVRRSYRDALAALDSARLALGRVRGGDTAATSVVVSQSPAAGMDVIVGSPVSLQLADSSPVRVPRLSGRSLRDASVLVDLAGLRLTLGTADPEDSSLTIAQQSPGAGALVPPNSAVLVVLAGGISPWWWAIPAGLAALAAAAALTAKARPKPDHKPPATPHVRLAAPDELVVPRLDSAHDPIVDHHVALIDQPAEWGIEHEPDLILSTEDASHE
jgi:beta-lactam-binding protein with PASTA domain